ncbi:sensor histidine kinase [Frigoribacterium salinisoli]
MHASLSRWWNEISIRTKVTAITVTLVTLGLFVAGLGTMTVLSTYLLLQVDTDLKNAAQNISTVQQSDTVCTATFGRLGTSSYVAVLDEEGEQLCDNSASLTPGSTPDLRDFDPGTAESPSFDRWNEEHTQQWRLYALDTQLTVKSTQDSFPATIVTGTNLAPTNATIGRFSGIFLGFGLSVVVLGAALTRLLVTSTFAPLRDVEATAARFADGDFSQRLDSTNPDTEVGRLNRSLNSMLSRIDSAFDDRARTIDQMRRFVGDASHELRTPLVSLRGYAELYRMGALTKDEDVAQAMDRIEKEAIRMGLLVQDLLALARLDESKPLELGPVDLVALARDSALDTMASNPDREIQVLVLEPVLDAAADGEGDAPGDDDEQPSAPQPGGQAATGPMSFAGATLARLRSRRTRAGRTADEAQADGVATGGGQRTEWPAVVTGEENKLRQVITNLMGNAMRFTESDGPIELVVQAHPATGVATIDIVDHGEGIPPQIREKIFQRFWRADSSRTRDTGGSGLGLAIVSGIVQAHQGNVDVLDTPGGGATFRVALPLWEGDVPAAPAPGATPSA